ncbi:MAG: hypothetical protein IJS08_10870, partial [Victivallales bacterium]|nr:hypothetical protein [Victivallales bacterium]
TAVFTNLPSSNSAFGLKAAVLSWEGPLRSNAYEVFFPKNGTNHPACSSCAACPNWFFYWREGNVCIPSNALFDKETEYYGYCMPSVDNIIRLGAIAAGENDGPRQYTKANGSSITVTGEGKGIKCVAETVAHERNHLLLYSYSSGHIIPLDTDNDGIVDADEPTMQNISTDVDNPDTYQVGSSIGDQEIRCYKIERDIEKSAYNPQADWANPGCQSKEQFGPSPDE